ncbi:metallophosphoesterase family protein [Candidatus Uabimicrobium sp. HlEnr_7]|uniref:metallophosphoesterase family protein n=1 Tax=Candidatus Uabimicrobium helgolandensis TaxID=3095367 RepID=UPI003557B343
MNHYIISDIHGYANLLYDLVETLKKTIQKEDTIVFLGDYINRGTNSKGVVDIVLQLKNEYNVVCLKGNHEQWMLQSFQEGNNSWIMGMDGFSTVASYSPEFADELRAVFKKLGPKIFLQKDIIIPYYQTFFKEIMPQQHLNFFLNLKGYYESEGLLCVHAGINQDRPLEEQQEQDLLWSLPQDLLHTWRGEQTIVMGHQGTHEVYKSMWGKPIITEKVILLDTSCYNTGVLSAIRFPDREVFQAALS